MLRFDRLNLPSHLFLVQNLHVLIQKSSKGIVHSIVRWPNSPCSFPLLWEGGNASFLFTVNRQHQSRCASWALPKSQYNRPQRRMTPSTCGLLNGLEPFSCPNIAGADVEEFHESLLPLAKARPPRIGHALNCCCTVRNKSGSSTCCFARC